MSRSKYYAEFRAKISQECIDGIGYSTLKGWINEYKIHGISAFCHKKNRRYSQKLKKECVEAVINGEGTVDEIIAKYGISSRSVLRQWIKMYNTNSELKNYDPRQEVYMAQARRKPTFEERKKIEECPKRRETKNCRKYIS